MTRGRRFQWIGALGWLGAAGCADLLGADFDGYRSAATEARDAGGPLGSGGDGAGGGSSGGAGGAGPDAATGGGAGSGGASSGGAGGATGGGGGAGGAGAAGGAGGAGATSGSGGDAGLVDAPPDAPLTCPALTEPYPPGPYGSNVDDTFPPLFWSGYTTPDASFQVNENGNAYVDFSADDLRRTCRRFALIHISEFICPGCKNAATEITANGRSVYDAGGVLVEILQTQDFGVPTRDDLDLWINGYDIPTHAVIDSSAVEAGQTYDQLGIRETAFIVDLSTMKILWKASGSTAGTGPPSVVDGITRVIQYLEQ